MPSAKLPGWQGFLGTPRLQLQDIPKICCWEKMSPPHPKFSSGNGLKWRKNWSNHFFGTLLPSPPERAGGSKYSNVRLSFVDLRFVSFKWTHFYYSKQTYIVISRYTWTRVSFAGIWIWPSRVTNSRGGVFFKGSAWYTRKPRSWGDYYPCDKILIVSNLRWNKNNLASDNSILRQ